MDNERTASDRVLQIGKWREFSEAVFCTIVYLLSVHFSLQLIVHPANVSVFWPPAGLLLAILLRRPYSFWLKFISLVLPLSTLIEWYGGRTVGLALAYTLVDLGEATLAAWLLGKLFGPRFSITSVRSLLGLVVVSCGLFATLGAAAAATIASVAKEPGSFLDVWRTWYSAVAIGILSTCPLVVCLCEIRIGRPNFKRIVEAIVVFGGLIGLSLWLFYSSRDSLQARPALLFSVFPLLLWASVRFSMPGATMASMTLSLIAGVCTAADLGPFAGFASGLEQVSWLQLFIMVMTATPLLLAATMVERTNAEDKLLLTQFSVDQAADAVVWVNRDATIRYANDSAARLLGFPAAALVGRDIQAFDPSWPKPRWHQAWHMLQRNRAVSFERVIVTPTGKKPVEITTSYLSFKGEEVFVAYVRDVSERQRVEQALRSSEQQYRTLVESASDGIFVSDRDGNYTDANPTACEMVGYTRSEIVAMNVRDMMSDVDLEREPLNYEQLEAGGLVLNRRKLRRKDGSFVNVEIHAQMLPDGRFLGIARNIANQLEYEEALRLTSEQNVRIIESLPCGVVRIDSSNIIRNMNRVAAEFLKTPATEAVGKPITFFGITLVAADGTESLPGENLVPRVLETQAPVGPILLGVKFPSQEMRHAVFTAVPFNNTVSGEFEGIVFAFVDVTKQKEDEQTLREAEAQLRLSVEALPVVFWTTDSELCLTSVLGAGAGINVGRGAQAIGTPIANLFAGNSKALPVLAHQRALEGQHQSFDWGWESQEYQFTIEPLRDSEKNIIGTVALGVDISERKMVEAEMRKFNEELEHRVSLRTSELEATVKELESFSYSVSHDLRSPLRALSGYAFILLEDYRDHIAEEAVEMLTRIDVNARRMSVLIDDLLAFSRMGRQPLKKQPADLAAIAMEAFREVVEPDDSKFTIEVAPMPEVMCDPKLLHQVFVNLFSNSVRFSKGRPVLRIEVGANTAARPPVFFVKDYGIGFEQRHADTIFGVFTRLNPASMFEGTGVGLAIVQRIIHRHEGRVWAESEPGVGTTIYFTLEGGIGESGSQ